MYIPDPTRDPRGHRISVTFIAKISGAEERAADDAEKVEWVSFDDRINLAFDHNKILNDYRQWKDNKKPTGHLKINMDNVCILLWITYIGNCYDKIHSGLEKNEIFIPPKI